MMNPCSRRFQQTRLPDNMIEQNAFQIKQNLIINL